MKKLFYTLIILIIIFLGIWYAYKHSKVSVQLPSITSTYTNPATGISFTYPKILNVGTENGTTIVQHSIPFEHHDYCDFKGEGTSTIPIFTDFRIMMHVTNKNLVDTMKAESPYIPAENFVNDTVVPSSGFIDPVEVGDLKGYKIFEGAEGCGHTIYYFPIASDKTLVVTQDFITIFSGAIDAKEGVKALKVPGVISKEKETEILNSILKSVQVK